MANSHTLGTFYSPRMWWADIEVPNEIVDMNSWISSACYPRSTFYPLSDDPSTQNHQITMTDFRLCSTCQSRSQAGLCHCTLTVGFRSTWAYLRAPPLLFRRRPPQSNYPPYRVPAPDSRGMVRYQRAKGWYFKDGSTKAGALASKPPTYPTHLLPSTTVKL